MMHFAHIKTFFPRGKKSQSFFSKHEVCKKSLVVGEWNNILLSASGPVDLSRQNIVVTIESPEGVIVIEGMKLYNAETDESILDIDAEGVFEIITFLHCEKVSRSGRQIHLLAQKAAIMQLPLFEDLRNVRVGLRLQVTPLVGYEQLCHFFSKNIAILNSRLNTSLGNRQRFLENITRLEESNKEHEKHRAILENRLSEAGRVIGGVEERNAILQCKFSEMLAVSYKREEKCASLLRFLRTKVMEFMRVIGSRRMQLLVAADPLNANDPRLREQLETSIQKKQNMQIAYMKKHGGFDTESYLNNNPDVKQAGLDPVEHYVRNGWYECRSPRQDFHGELYLLMHPDLVFSGLTPYFHELINPTKDENAAAVDTFIDVFSSLESLLEFEINTIASSNLFDVRHYTEDCPDLEGKNLIELIRHYLTVGYGQGRSPNSWFTVEIAADSLDAARCANLNPLTAFILFNQDMSCPTTDEKTENVQGQDLQGAFLAWHQDAPIYFPPTETPEVSIIIPAYRNLHYLINCLKSLAVHVKTEPSFEVIVVDDCPEEGVCWAIPDSGGLIKVRNAQNLGFLRSCNRGVTFARGKYLCFLNSDTIVSAGWLQELVHAFKVDGSVGIAGSLLIGNDGYIQEAGWYLLHNGWGHPIGRGKNPNDSLYSFDREVSCITGACFVIAKDLFSELDGFDQIYAPAFYEEFDLCFRVRKRHRKVVYAAKSRVVHLSSVSYGKEKRNKLSRTNHYTFYRRHKEILRKKLSSIDDDFMSIYEYQKGPVVVFVDIQVPRPNCHAGDITVSSYVSLFVAAGWRVIFFPSTGLTNGPFVDALERQGVMVIRPPHTLANWLEKYGKYVNYVWLARPDLANAYLEALRSHTAAKVVYYTHDLHHLRLEREARIHNSESIRKEADRIKGLELDVFSQVDSIMSPNADESSYIQNLFPNVPVATVVPYYFEDDAIFKRDAEHFKDISNIIFIGGFPHTPNVDAALFIVNEIMPIVWRQFPNTKLFLIGYAPPPEVQALAAPNVIVTGQVPDLEPYYAKARVALVALRYGAGVKGKTIEALRFGVPVVSTFVGIEGINIDALYKNFVADDCATLADNVIKLLSDEKLCQDLSRSGTGIIHEYFSKGAARAAINAIFRVDRCAVCGSINLIDPRDEENYREAFVCRDCFALARTEAIGRVVLSYLAKGGESCLAELVHSLGGLRIHEFGFVGSIVDILSGNDFFTTSDFFDDVPPGKKNADNILCQDMTRLTFPSNMFDLVISQDVMEHVPDPWAAFREIYRVLNPGGIHVFTTPQDDDLPHSVTRALAYPEGITFKEEPIYHGDPIRSAGALVFTDFGRDFTEMLASLNIQLFSHDVPVSGKYSTHTVRVFAFRKPT